MARPKGFESFTMIDVFVEYVMWYYNRKHIKMYLKI